MSNFANVVDATDEASGHDTDGTVSAWTEQSVAVGGSASGWRTAVVEITETMPYEPPGGFNPSSIIGASAISWIDVTEGEMFQDAGRTTPAGIGDPVRSLPDYGTGKFFQEFASQAVPTLRDGYLEFSATNQGLQLAHTFTGAGLWVGALMRTPGDPQSQTRRVYLATNSNASTSWWANPSFSYKRYFGSHNAGFDADAAILPSESFRDGPFQAPPSDHQSVFYAAQGGLTTGALFEHRFNGGTPTTIQRTGPLGSPVTFNTAYLGGALNSGTAQEGVVMDVVRLYVLDREPTAEERVALQEWLENGDPGGSGDPVTIETPAAAVAVAGHAPAVAGGARVTAPSRAVQIASSAPSVASGTSIRPQAATLAVSSLAPAVAAGAAITVPAAEIGLAAAGPLIVTSSEIAVPGVTISLSANPPSVSSGASLVSELATVSLATWAPRVASGKSIAVPATVISTGSSAPSVASGAATFLAAASIALAAFAPSISTGVSINVPAAGIAAAPHAPQISAGARIDAPAAVVQVQANTPNLGAGVTIGIPAAALQIQQRAPQVSTGVLVAVQAASVQVGALAPAVASGAAVAIPSSAIVAAAVAPDIEALAPAVVAVPIAAVSLAGVAPQIIIGELSVQSARRAATPAQSANGGRLRITAKGGRLIQSRNGGRLV